MDKEVCEETLDTRAGPIERTTGGTEKPMDKEVCEETLDTRAGPIERTTEDIEQLVNLASPASSTTDQNQFSKCFYW